MRKVIFVLRLALGWLFTYAGLTKIVNPSWSAAGYLKNAESFGGLFSWFAAPANIGWVNFVNEWGLLVVGLLLIFGLWTKWAAIGGIVLMALYYLPILNFPYVGDHSFLVDEHVIYALALWLLIKTDAGKYKGMDGKKKK